MIEIPSIVVWLDKYWKILLPVVIVVLFFLVYWTGTCVGKRSVKTTTDTIQQHIDKVEKHNAVLLAQVDSLKAKIHSDSVRIVTIENHRDSIRTVYIYTSEQISNLPLDSGVQFMADNLTDKTKISVSVKGKDTIVGITPKDVKQINIAFVQRDYFSVDNDALISELGYMSSKDSSQVQIIKKYEEVIFGKDMIIDAKDTQVTDITAQLKEMTKKKNSQFRQKLLYKFLFLVTLGYAAVK